MEELRSDLNVRGPLSPAMSAPNLPVDSDDSALEDYLDQIYIHLVGKIDYASRQEIREELREHLKALVHAYRDLGIDEESAISKALARFGSPRAMARQWLRSLPRRWTLKDEFWLAVRIFGLSLLGLMILSLWRPWDMQDADAFAGSCILPLLAGIHTGYQSRRTVPIGPAGALIFMALTSYVLTSIAYMARLNVPLDDPRGLPELLLLWLPFGAMGYVLVGKIRRVSAFLSRTRIAKA